MVGWEKEWIDTARDLIRDEFNCSYQDHSVDKDVAFPSDDNPSESDLEIVAKLTTKVCDCLPLMLL